MALIIGLPGCMAMEVIASKTPGRLNSLFRLSFNLSDGIFARKVAKFCATFGSVYTAFVISAATVSADPSVAGKN